MFDDFVAIFDIDGVLTDGTFWQSKDGKFLKRFGPDDFDAIDELCKHMSVGFITADQKGFPIVEKRMGEKGLPLDLVSNKPVERWEWIKKTYPDKKIIYVGDGIYDWYALSEADAGITTIDALEHVRERATYVSPRTGANRFVADACLYILSMIGVSTWKIGT